MNTRQCVQSGTLRLRLPLLLLLAVLAIGISGLLSRPARAATCSVPSGLYPTIQAAITDTDCDTINIAAGIFEEQLRISRSLTLAGAGRSSTIINGQGQGRPITISGATTEVQLTGLRLTDGVALPAPRAGGGLLVQDGATLHGSDLTVDNNTASELSIVTGLGGGLAVVDGTAYLTNTQVLSNTALRSGKGSGYGGGIYVAGADEGTGRAILSLVDSQVRNNMAYDSNAAGDDIGQDAAGGGLYVGASADTQITLEGNIWEDNTTRSISSIPDDGDGGAVAVESADTAVLLTITEDTFRNNAANRSLNTSADDTASGGALYLNSATAGGIQATFADLTFENNIARDAGLGDAVGQGGAIYARNSSISFADSSLLANIAGNSDQSAGGGAIALVSANMTGERLQIRENIALEGSGSPAEGEAGRGGGIALDETAVLTLTNSIIADNLAANTEGNGAGLYVGPEARSRLVHVTVAAAELNPQAGIYAAQDGNSGDVQLINTIVTSHTTGIENQGVSGRVALERLLFFGNGSNIAGEVTGSDDNITAPPRFINPDEGNYLIGPDSGAINRATNAGITTDINGNERPLNNGFDIGADEYPEPISVLTAAINGPTLGPPGDYAFAGDFGPLFATQPVSYTWDNGDTTPFSIYTFEETGEYTIELTVTNNNNSASATVTHTVSINRPQSVEQCPEALTEVTLTGPNDGTVEVGKAAIFEVTALPDNASLPIDYIWAPAPDAGPNATSAGFTWETGGEKPVAVTVQGCRNSVAAAQIITIPNPPLPAPPPEEEPEMLYLPLVQR